MQLQFERVTKSFGDLRVIDTFDTTIRDGEIVALVGPSGCGKSTLLHMVAGLQSATEGEVRADGKRVERPAPERTLVFQEHALYPWMTLRQNVALALEFQGRPAVEARRQATQWLARVKLDGFEEYYPHQVSGGMRQRCALARAFIARPKVLLLDEPFGALDALTRMTLQSVLKELIEEERPTVVLVTHDVDEALYLADRVLVFSHRPARVLEAFNLGHIPKTHDLSAFADIRREVLSLLGIDTQAEATERQTEKGDVQ
ncbi:ABC transporter ATP-binding protein [Halomonas sp. MCCC 1A17488]|uniref:ABC transporter ATP-binding protein n=1 Tax=Billgrantia sulfidoxydans TaxID=2733484 RepID=A0ABX7VYB9_9GAMM|nr:MULTISPECIES: ABC transporter ATP-binding protein [Halomonas]MCE8017088.1 ABC transporter ATP-binding protein [Halomonas sp. MCCC 1A17488]MCG3240421.1 ABC transporter ATP-binding protein [Halomonas sp. MCCC 1A17488]QPP49715.1 ABC transporter ATP-binding protein [Halomonas sp. SS10-MC5]QTP53326.1 ABC transporter ATP-binding protein [Halomonas sulfidoxydans]